MGKPTTAAGYVGKNVALVRATCLYVATKLGDLLDELVIVGGLVPTLLIAQEKQTEKHVGTIDLDVGMAVAILDERRYEVLTERLRAAGFGPDVNDKGNQVRQRWMIDGLPKVTIDFLIAPTLQGDKGGDLRDLQADFAAIIAPGLRLAFANRVQVLLDGTTIKGEEAQRNIWVCGAGAFVLIKALAFKGRGENKDVYDLTYVLRNYGAGPGDVATQLVPLLVDPEATDAVAVLRRDFAKVESVGPRRVAEFLFDAPNAETQADAWGAVQDLLAALPK